MNLLVFALKVCLLVQAAGCCTSGFMQLDVLQRRAMKIPSATANSPNRLNNEFRLIPSMSFTCKGTITGLLLGADVRTVTNTRSKYPEVQIWRKTGNFYRKQGSQEIQMAAGDFSPDGVLVYNLTSPIQFKSGDVLGFYQPKRTESVVTLYYNVPGTNKNDGDDSAPVTYRIRGENPIRLNSTELRRVTGQNIFLSPITEPPCTSGFLNTSSLRHTILEENINRIGIRCRQQRIFPDIYFTCNGSIIKWIVGANTSAYGADKPELQIWRRDSGRNYTKTNFSFLTPNETSDTNVHEYYPDTPLEFQEGDILGVYQPRCSDSQIVVYNQFNTGPQNYRQSGIDPPAPSVFTINTLTRCGYPLVTVEISMLSFSTIQGVSATRPLLLPSTSMITPPTLPPLDSMKVMYVLIGGGVVLILAVLMVTSTVLICLYTRAKRRKGDQVESNGCGGLEVSVDASPREYCTLSSDKAGHVGGSSDTTDEQIMMEANPAYLSTANQVEVEQSFPIENNESEYEDMSGFNIYETVEDIS